MAVILATMGTTDAFGIDDLASLVALRDDLAARYGVEHPPIFTPIRSSAGHGPFSGIMISRRIPSAFRPARFFRFSDRWSK